MALVTLGWREWVVFPALGDLKLEAKLDTGARTSTLHAEAVETFRRRGRAWVRFTTSGSGRLIELPTIDRRDVRSSTGHTQERYVVETDLIVGAVSMHIELTLADRSRMRYPMLVGRTALAGRFAVDPARVHLADK